MKEPIAKKAKDVDFDNTNRFIIIRNRIKSMIEFANDNGGWTVIGWYRCGESIDTNRVENGDRLLVDAETFQQHVVRILPSNPAVTDFNLYKRMLVDFNDENIEELVI